MTTSTIESTDTESMQYATFYVGGLLLGIPIHQVQEINRHLEVTHVPHASSAIRGVINLRGEVVSVVDLPHVLGLPSAEITATSRNVIIHHGDELIGLMVDDVADILAIQRCEISPSPANVNGVEGRFFKGVHTTETEIVVILDVEESLG